MALLAAEARRAKASRSSAAIAGPMTRAPRHRTLQSSCVDALAPPCRCRGRRRADAGQLARGDRRRRRPPPQTTIAALGLAGGDRAADGERDVGVVVVLARGRSARGRPRDSAEDRRRAAGSRRGRRRSAILMPTSCPPAPPGPRAARPRARVELLPGEQRRAAHAGLRPVARQADLRPGADAGQREAPRHLAGGLEQQLAGRADAAADHDDVGIEGVDRVGDADAQPLAEDVDRLQGAGSPLARGLDRAGPSGEAALAAERVRARGPRPATRASPAAGSRRCARRRPGAGRRRRSCGRARPRRRSRRGRCARR